MLKVYTKKGDDGCSELYSGQRMPKTHNIFTSLRCNDELTSRIGMARSIAFTMYCSGNITKIKFNYVDLALERIQGELQTLNSDIATISGPFYDQTRFVNSREATSDLEEDIDYMTSELPVLKTFILPGGNMLSSQLHLCRTATRTAEAAINWPFTVEGSDIYVLKSNKAYINRLSDFFFTMARYVNLKDDVTIRLPKTRYNHVACCTIAVAIGIFTIISTW